MALPWIFPCWFPDKANWINGTAALGTLGALIFLIIDKVEKEREEKEIFWHEHLPYLTVGSPCDPTQNRCEINLLENIDEIGSRGAILFSIVNFSSANAFDVNIDISTSTQFEPEYTRKHFIDFIPVYRPQRDEYSYANASTINNPKMGPAILNRYSNRDREAPAEKVGVHPTDNGPSCWYWRLNRIRVPKIWHFGPHTKKE